MAPYWQNCDRKSKRTVNMTDIKKMSNLTWHCFSVDTTNTNDTVI